MMTEWLCRRYLKSQGVEIHRVSTSEMYKRCDEELAFLESLAMAAVESNTILLRPVLLETSREAAKLPSQKYCRTLNIGFVKSIDKSGIGTATETDKDHYFLHLSF